MEGTTQVFTKGMHSDNDPRYQPEGTYRDATNVKLISTDGDTFSIENIAGNKETERLGCADIVYRFRAVITGTNAFTVGDSYQWNLNLVNFTNYGASTVTQSQLGPYVYSDQENLVEDIATTINAITDTSGAKLFNAYNNTTEVVVESITSNNFSGAWSQIIGIGPTSGTGSTLAYSAASMNNGFSKTPSGGSIAHTATTSEALNPLQLVKRFDRLCRLTIVGHYSFGTELYLFTYDYVSGTDDGQIWKLEFYNDGTIKSKSVIYNNALTFDKSRKLIVEGIVENDCITRLYWTDNFKPIRSLNLTDPNAFAFKLNDLIMSPLTNMDRPVLKKIDVGGRLEVGMYQVGYRLISQGGSKSNISPLSNLISVSMGNSADYNDVNSGDPGNGIASAGEISTTSFTVVVNDIDTDFENVEFYILVYEVFGSSPTKILRSPMFTVSVPTFEYTHTDNNLTSITAAEFLIDSNTFDTCKDIAVKDQRLFAANLKTTAKDISTFDTEVYRWKANDVAKSLDTTSFDGGCDFVNNNGMNNGSGGLTAWTNTQLSAVTLANGKKTNESGVFSDNDTDYKYLPIAPTNAAGGYIGGGNYNSLLLGAQTRYFDETKGGIRITFQTTDRIVDTQKNYGWWKSDGWGNGSAATVINGGQRYQETQNMNMSPGDSQFVKKDVTNTIGTSVIDSHSENGDTFYQNISYDSNENPFISYSSRGYQRGETYRFAITFFDKNYKEIRTKYIGDIKMPEHWENQYKLYDDTDTSIEYDGTQGVGFPGMELYDSANYMIDQNIYCEDFRISYIKGLRNPYNDYTEYGSAVGAAAQTIHRVGNERDRPDIFPWACPQLHAIGHTHSSVVTGHINHEIPMAAAYNDGYSYREDTSSGSVATQSKYGDADFNHYVQDLHLRFEVIIPEDLKDTIGAYKIVRVKREERDKTIKAQGLLTQCVYHEDTKVQDGWQAGVGMSADLTIFQAIFGGTAGSTPDLIDEWASRLHKKYAPYCNPNHFMEEYLPPTGQAPNKQPAWGMGPSHQYPTVSSQNMKQGQLNDFSGKKLMGYNKYFTFDSPDTIHMSRGWTHESGCKLDIISVLKNVDKSKIKVYNRIGTTSIGSDWIDKPGYIGTSRAFASLFQGRVWMPQSNLGHAGWSGRMMNSWHEVYYTKFFVYDTKSFKFPQSLLNLKNNVTSSVNTPTASTGGTANHYWQNNLTIKNSKKIEAGGQAPISGINFSNNQTCYHMITSYSPPTFSTAKSYSGSTMQKDTLSGEGRRSSVGQCCESVFLVLEDGAEKILSVPDLDRYYLNATDTPMVEQGQDQSGENWNRELGRSRVPFALLANIKRVVNNQYGGNSTASILYNRFIDTGHFTYVGDNNSGVQTSKVFGGDIFVQFYGKEKYTGGKIDAEVVSRSDHWDKKRAGNCTEWYFPVETYVNTDLLHGGKKLREDIYRNFPATDQFDAYNNWVSYGPEDNNYNEVYSQEPDLKGYVVTDEDDCEVLHLPHQIAFSNVKLSGEPKKDAWKNFNIYDFHDVDGVHGPINNLFVLNDFRY